MEKDYEGFNKAVKLVCQAQNNLRGIHGPVAGLMKTDGKYSLAIEIALGAGLQNIVVDREEDAKSAIAFLKQREGGRATFLPLTAIRGEELRERGVEAEFGFVGIASRLVRFDPRYTNIFQNLLGRTVIAEDLDCGIAMASGADAACQVAQLVLLDLKLPFFNGFHWCEEIRKISQGPVMFLSSAADNMNCLLYTSPSPRDTR